MILTTRRGFHQELGEAQQEDMAHLDAEAEPDVGGAEVEDEESGKNDAGGRAVRPLHSCERDTIAHDVLAEVKVQFSVLSAGQAADWQAGLCGR